MRQIELLKLGENVLKKENIQDSHIKASTLLQYVLKQTKQELIINSKEIVEPSKVNKYNNYLQKIIKGTPIQYITKHQQFMALDFYVDENVLIPQPDTEVLVEEGIKIIKEGVTFVIVYFIHIIRVNSVSLKNTTVLKRCFNFEGNCRYFIITQRTINKIR